MSDYRLDPIDGRTRQAITVKRDDSTSNSFDFVLDDGTVLARINVTAASRTGYAALNVVIKTPTDQATRSVGWLNGVGTDGPVNQGCYEIAWARVRR